jgi:hypothetical protein
MNIPNPPVGLSASKWSAWGAKVSAAIRSLRVIRSGSGIDVNELNSETATVNIDNLRREGDAPLGGQGRGGGGGGTVTVTVEDASGYAPGDGVSEVDNVTTITFDQDNFEIYDGGGGQCVVKLKTCPATCP